MRTSQPGQWALPSPYRTTKKRNRDDLSQRNIVASPRSQQKSNADFPAQSSHHFTQVRVVLLTIVLVGVTLGMLLSFVWMFDGDVPLNALMRLPSLSIMGLISVGAAAGIVLWMAHAFLQRPAAQRPAQSTSVSPYPPILAARAVFPPEPYQTDELFSSRFPSRVDQWTTSGWKMDTTRRNTETLEARHMRQRLSTLQLAYSDAFPGDQDKEHGYPSAPRSVHHQGSYAVLKQCVL